MLNFIWFGMLLAGIILSFVSGNTGLLASSALSGAERAVTLSVSLCAVYALWLGLLNIAEKSGLTNAIASGLKFFLKRLFPIAYRDGSAVGDIAVNISANMLGLGNAATPAGISAMKKMQKAAGAASNEMILLLVINSSSIQLIPTTVVGLRAQAGAVAPADIILPVLISTFSATAAGILACKLFSRRRGTDGLP